MKLYSYNEITKEYIEEIDAYLDPEESAIQGKDIYMHPANTTELEPPTVEENEVVLFENGQWVVYKDYRGKYQCSENLEIKSIEKIGDIEDGCILITEEEANKIAEDRLFYIVKNGELIENPNYETELIQQEKARIQELFMTRSDFFDGTIDAWGVGEDELLFSVQRMLTGLPLENNQKLKAINNFKNALNFYRKHDLFKMLIDKPIQLTELTQVIITEESLDKYFDEVAKGNKDTAWQYLPQPMVIPIETPGEIL